jgi:S1-C subfamily serine protease
MLLSKSFSFGGIRLLSMLLVLIAVWCPALVTLAQENTQPGINTPIEELTSGVIDNRRIYNTFVNRGRRLITTEPLLDSKDIREKVKQAPARLAIDLPEVPPVGSDDFHDRIRKASVMVGSLYDCGRCNNLHGNISGGVVISQDGLILTNHHVLKRKEDEKTQGMLVMNHLGQCFAIEQVLAAWESADVALIKIKSSEKFDPVPLASSNPKPLSQVVVMSHPHNEFFVVTTGLASRLTKPTMEGDSTTWLEITAEFSGGSSGSGVFNSECELVGLVSRIHPMFREQEKSDRPRKADSASDPPESAAGRLVYPEQILRRCVPIESIRKMLTP